MEKSYRSEYAWTEGRFGEDPLEHVLREERRQEMLEAMTDNQREVFILYYQEGYTMQEIAEMIGVSKPAVCMRLGTAIESMKKYYS